MKRYVYLNINKGLLFLVMSGLTGVGLSPLLREESEWHGFLTQGFFHFSDNNLFGQSDDGISTGLTEIGLNAAYQAFDRLRFAAQGPVPSCR